MTEKRTPTAAAVLLFCLRVAGAVALVLGWTLIGSAITAEVPGVFGVPVALGLIAAFLYVHVRRGWLRDRTAGRLSPPRSRVPLPAVGVAVALALLAGNVAWSLGPGEWVPTLESRSPAFFLIGVLFAPLAEEVGYRGWVQTPLERPLGPVLAVALVAGAFAVSHGDDGFLPRFLGGVFTGAVVWASGSVWPAVVIHAVNNGAAVALTSWPAFADSAARLASAQWLGPLAVVLYVWSVVVGAWWVRKVRRRGSPAAEPAAVGRPGAPTR